MKDLAKAWEQEQADTSVSRRNQLAAQKQEEARRRKEEQQRQAEERKRQAEERRRQQEEQRRQQEAQKKQMEINKRMAEPFAMANANMQTARANGKTVPPLQKSSAFPFEQKAPARSAAHKAGIPKPAVIPAQKSSLKAINGKPYDSFLDGFMGGSYQYSRRGGLGIGKQGEVVSAPGTSKADQELLTLKYLEKYDRENRSRWEAQAERIRAQNPDHTVKKEEPLSAFEIVDKPWLLEDFSTQQPRGFTPEPIKSQSEDIAQKARSLRQNLPAANGSAGSLSGGAALSNRLPEEQEQKLFEWAAEDRLGRQPAPGTYPQQEKIPYRYKQDLARAQLEKERQKRETSMAALLNPDPSWQNKTDPLIRRAMIAKGAPAPPPIPGKSRRTGRCR